MGSYERSGFASGWLCAFLWWSVLLCSDVGSTFYCPRFWRVLFCGTLTDGEVGLGPSSSRPVAVSPPFWGWVCFGGLAGVVVHLRDAWRGFSSLGWLAGCSLGSLSFYFEQLVSMPLFPREEGRVF